jgi:ABC-type nitrate/sulfonate/bicarbonate transport system ATPase subunit
LAIRRDRRRPRPDPEPDLADAGPVGLELALTHRFGELLVLDDVALSLEAEAVLAVVGPSGCGKSTLLELIAGLGEPGSGTISLGGVEDAPGRLARAAYMPQRDMLLPWLRAVDNAALPLRLEGVDRTSARQRAAELFEQLGIAGFERARPAELSGGMRQRVAFARTLLSGKPLLLLDEPFAALDAITRAGLQGWLREALEAVARTAVLVTHDVEEALFVADRVAVLSPRPGRVVAELDAPAVAGTRRDTVTRPDFVAARDRALAALGAPG